MTFSIDLNGFIDGTHGFVLNGIDANDGSGVSVSSAGDVNGDGYGDLIIGAWQADPNGKGNAGESYVMFGKAGGFTASVELSSLNGTNGFVINGIHADDQSGFMASGAGDVNADGFADLIIGARYADPNGIANAGEAYVVFGKAGGFTPSLNLSTLDGTNGFAINGVDAGDLLGRDVSGAGDVNGDGYDDVIIGAERADPNGKADAGESYVVFGRATGYSAILELSSLNGTNGFVIKGSLPNDNSGYSVSGAGDVNGDGYDDLIVGALQADPNGKSSAGETYVVFGKASGFDASLEPSTLNGTNGFVLSGVDAFDNSGLSVSGAEDVNRDGYDDLIIGALQADPNGKSSAGETYVVFGKASGFDANLELSTLNGTNGFIINGINPGDVSGVSVSDAGDINGDGYDDLIIGANHADPDGKTDAGESYVVFGKAGGFAASVELSSLDGTNGFVINGIDSFDYSGRRVSGAGDINGDGYDDLIIGAWGADPHGKSKAGESYVLFGRASFTDCSDAPQFLQGNASDNVLTGGCGNDTLRGCDDNDSLFGGNGNDTLYGNANNDTLSGEDGNDRLFGGAGDDWLRAHNGNNTVYGGDGNDYIRGKADDDCLFGDDGNDHVLGNKGADSINGGNGDDTLEGGLGRDTVIGGAGNDVLEGQGESDQIDGGAGNDIVRGGGGNDTLLGGDGHDKIVGNAGDDLMTGGADADRFVFRVDQTTDGVVDHDVITDYDASEGDKIELKSGVAVEDHDVIGGNLVLSLTGGDQVELQGITSLADVVLV